MLQEEFKLSATLFGHSLDVRCVNVNHRNYILSASRDKSCKLWVPNGVKAGFSEALTFCGHSNYVSVVCSLMPSSKFTNGVIVSGGNDHNICVFLSDSPDPIITLKGHDNTVCSITRGNVPDTFVTSSWDCTAKLWQISEKSLVELVVFKGHEMAVWCAIQLPNSNIATASADKQIWIWSENGQKLKVLEGHTDCVRSLVVVNEKLFASASNDASIRLWSVVDGVCLDTIYGHTNYIYSICANKALGDDSFVTAGEDRVVKCWKNGENTQTILLPAQSVWSVACLANGDIVTGSSDGVVRIFTQDSDRIADEQQLKMFEQDVEKLNIAANKEIGGVKITDLPGKEVLYEPGRTNGQTKLIREGDSVICYSWSTDNNTWNKVGDVLGAAGGTQATSGKILYEGKEYDYVFSIDIEDGKPPVKLPYNKNQDPWYAAQDFIYKNNLPQVYLDQIANFIVQNSDSIVITQQNNDFHDPLTGENRYVPASGNNTNNSGNSGRNLDPFTGGSSYSTSGSTVATTRNVQENLPANPDPFTSSVSHVSNSPIITTTTYFPHLSYLYFDQANLNAIHEKLKEFNNKTDENISNVDENLLEGTVKLANGSGDEIFMNTLKQLLFWPYEIVYPVLDITRLAVRHLENNNLLCSQNSGELLIELLRKYIVQNSAANKMLSLRILCNMFSHTSGEILILTHENSLSSDISNLGSNLNKNCQIALSTFLLNLSIALIKAQNWTRLLSQAEIITKIILNLNDSEAEFRSFVALGNVMVNINKTSSTVNNLFIPQLREKLQKIYKQTSNDSLKLRNINCAQQLDCLFT